MSLTPSFFSSFSRSSAPRSPSASAFGKATAALVLGAITMSLVTGCRATPNTNTPSYKKGELGNGSFAFRCDDSVACDRWSNSANTFPDKVATGAVFDVAFVPNGDTTGFVFMTDRETTASGSVYNGTSAVTYTPIAPFMSSGPDGFTTVKPGFGVIAARDARGFIIDYVTDKIVKPDGLVIYDAEYKGNDPERLEKIDLRAGESEQFRTVAEINKEAIAGALRTSWKSADPAIADVVSYSHGVVTIKGKAKGKTKLTAEGGALSQEIDVEVTADETASSQNNEAQP